jgi:WD40 repeat protein
VANRGRCDRRITRWESDRSITIGGGGTGKVTIKSSIAFSPDEKLLASDSDDSTVRIGNLEIGKCDRPLELPKPYGGMAITGVTGFNNAKREMLKELSSVFPLNLTQVYLIFNFTHLLRRYRDISKV